MPTTVTKAQMAAPEASLATGASTRSGSSSRRRPPEGLAEPEALPLIRACSSRAPTGIRNRALRCGLRISEALALELRDVDLQAGTIRVRHGKGDTSRTASTRRRRHWRPAGLIAGEASGPAPAAPVFCTLSGGRVDPSDVRHLLPRLARKADLDRACTPTVAGTPTPPISRASARRSTSSAMPRPLDARGHRSLPA